MGTAGHDETRIHYLTKDGGPPNGGLPPGRHAGNPVRTGIAFPPQVIETERWVVPTPPSCIPKVHYSPPPAYTFYPYTPTPPPHGHVAPTEVHLVYERQQDSPPPSSKVAQVPPARTPPPMAYLRTLPYSPDNPPPRSDVTKLANCEMTFTDGTHSMIHPPEGYTTFHLVEAGVFPRNGGMDGRIFRFRKHICNPEMTVQSLIEALYLSSKDLLRAKEIGIQECHEIGSGKWREGSTFRSGVERSKKRLKEVGWGPTRGKERKPVVLAYGPA